MVPLSRPFNLPFYEGEDETKKSVKIKEPEKMHRDMRASRCHDKWISSWKIYHVTPLMRLHHQHSLGSSFTLWSHFLLKWSDHNFLRLILSSPEFNWINSEQGSFSWSHLASDQHVLTVDSTTWADRRSVIMMKLISEHFYAAASH